MKKSLLVSLMFLSLLQANAQQKNFKQTVKEMEQILFSPDTALFDDEMIRLARFYENGNIESFEPIDNEIEIKEIIIEEGIQSINKLPEISTLETIEYNGIQEIELHHHHQIEFLELKQ